MSSVYGEHRTTIYLPDLLKARLEQVARDEQRSEADVIREALDAALSKRVRPQPRVPLVPGNLGDPTAAERVDELFDGFGAA